MLSDVLQFVEQGSEPNLIGSWTVLAASGGWAFLSVLARFLGLLMLSPLFGSRGISIWFRVGLSICLAAVIAPLLLDQDLATLPTDEWSGGVRLFTELVIGSLLGFGMLFIFAGLKLAGELIDQQSSVAVQEVFDPSGSDTATLSGQLLTFVGTLSLLCASPRQGYLQIVSTLIDSFVTLPGSAVGSGEQFLLWICHLGHQSLSLALQVAAPVLAAGVIVSWGFVGLSGGSAGSPVTATWLGLPLRVVLSLVILAAGMTGMTDAFLSQLEDLWLSLPNLLSRT